MCEVQEYGDMSYRIGETCYNAEANVYSREEDVDCAVERIMEDRDLDVEQSVSDTVSFGFGDIYVERERTESRQKIKEALLGLLALQGWFEFYLS